MGITTYTLITSIILAGNLHAGIHPVSAHGVVADGKTDNARALQAIIDTCSGKGGGTVVIDKGTVVSGTFSLKNNVTLEIAAGAVLKCADTTNAFPWVAVDFPTCYPQRRCFIYAQNQNNIGVAGKGTIDGNGAMFPRSTHGSESARISLIRFDGCKNVTIKDITLTAASMWTQHYYRCDNLKVSGITVDNTQISTLNDDGLNIDGCHDVAIDNCNIKTHDDCITLKNTSHRECRNVSIAGCKMQTGKSGLKFGTESLDGFINVTARNLDISGGRDAIALLSVDGARMENILVEDVTVKDSQCPIFIRLGSRMRKIKDDPKEYGVGSAKGITIRKLQATGCCRAILVAGIDGHRIQDVMLEDIDVNFVSKDGDILAPGLKAKENNGGYPASTMFGNLSSWGLFIRHAENVKLRKVKLVNAALDPQRMEYSEDVKGLVHD